MIDRKPAPGDWSTELAEVLAENGGNTPAPMLHEAIPARQSQVLGPDGNPVCVAVPRRVIGFDLRPRKT